MSTCETFASGAFKLECGRIDIAKGGSAPVSISGPGEIFQNEDGRLKFKVHLAKSDFSVVFRDLHQPLVAGTITPEEEVWNLTAHDYAENCWKGKLPDFRTVGLPIFPGGGMICGWIPMMANEQAYASRKPNQESAVLYMPNRLAFPEIEMSKSETSYGKNAGWRSASRDHSNFKSGSDEFLIAQAKEYSWVQCLFSPGGIKDNLHIRIQEALMFALGQTVKPCAVVTRTHERERTELWSFSKRKNELLPKQAPPLHFDPITLRQDVFQIALRYYESIKSRKDSTWDDITCHVYYIIQSANAVQELSSLMLGVAAEGLANSCFSSVAMPDPEFLSALKQAETRISHLTDHLGLRARMSGALSGMKNARNSDRLRYIVDLLGMDKQVFKAWQRTRNAAAHGVVDQGCDFSDTHLRNMQVLYLCYRIVLDHIGYHGLITDYSTLGHPDITI